MSRLKLLILDANVVIHLHELGIWSKLIGLCDVHLPRTVVGEVSYYEADGEKCYIDIEPDVAEQRVHVFDVTLSDIKAFRDQFDPLYVEGLDPGECESLAYLCKSVRDFLISSGDAIVYRVLGGVVPLVREFVGEFSSVFRSSPRKSGARENWCS